VMGVVGDAFRFEVPLDADLAFDDHVDVLEGVALEPVLDDEAVVAYREHRILFVFLLSLDFGEAEVSEKEVFIGVVFLDVPVEFHLPDLLIGGLADFGV